MLDSQILYVIIPYFNFVQYKALDKNLDIFIKNMSLYQNVKIVLVEGVYNNIENLPDYSDKIFMHIKISLKHILWVKDNLINIGFKHLPANWQYGAWLDRDITFSNPNWVTETIKKLKTCDIVQPWKECIHLTKKYNTLRRVWAKNKTPFNGTYSSCAVHKLNIESWPDPGLAWAINKTFYTKIGGLYDTTIVDNTDLLLCICINRKKESSIKSYSAFEDKEIFLKHYSNSFNNYYQKFDGCKSDYVEGLILHNFHGTLHNRQYFELLNIAIKYNFNEDDLCKDENGTLYFTEKGLRMQNEIINYFLNRKEDN